MMNTSINMTAILMFLAFISVTMVITWWASRRTRTASDYYAAGSGITGFQNGLAIAGDYMSAASFLGISALVFSSGFDGLIYSNIWITNLVAVIDPQNGKVVAIIDASELVIKGKGKGEVLNGIAYNNLSKKIYMTGKYWSKLFEISVVKTLAKAS